MLGLSSIFLFNFFLHVFCNSTKTITNSSGSKYALLSRIEFCRKYVLCGSEKNRFHSEFWRKNLVPSLQKQKFLSDAQDTRQLLAIDCLTRQASLEHNKESFNWFRHVRQLDMEDGRQGWGMFDMCPDRHPSSGSLFLIKCRKSNDICYFLFWLHAKNHWFGRWLLPSE